MTMLYDELESIAQLLASAVEPAIKTAATWRSTPREVAWPTVSSQCEQLY